MSDNSYSMSTNRPWFWLVVSALGFSFAALAIGVAALGIGLSATRSAAVTAQQQADASTASEQELRDALCGLVVPLAETPPDPVRATPLGRTLITNADGSARRIRCPR